MIDLLILPLVTIGGSQNCQEKIRVVGTGGGYTLTVSLVSAQT